MTETQKNSIVTEPRGPKPRKIMSRRNIILYGTLLVVAIYYLIPLYVMIVTSLKGMPEIRLGNIFSPPLEVTFEPWICLLYTSPSPRDGLLSRMPSSA